MSFTVSKDPAGTTPTLAQRAAENLKDGVPSLQRSKDPQSTDQGDVLQRNAPGRGAADVPVQKQLDAMVAIDNMAATRSGGSVSKKVNESAWDGGKDDAITKGFAKDLKSKDPAKADITKTATDAYVNLLKDPNASEEDIGKAQRAVMLAFQMQYPNADPATLKANVQNYILSVLNKDEVKDSPHKSAAVYALDQMDLSDTATKNTPSA